MSMFLIAAPAEHRRTIGNFLRCTTTRANCMWLSKFRTYMTKSYAGSKHKSYKITKMQMFAI